MRFCLAVLLPLWLAACAGEPSRAPIEERGKGVVSKQSSVSRYTVSKGDTLYTIAWRFGYDYRKLALANTISAPYTIYPGQKLVLTEAVSAKALGAMTSSATRRASSAKTTFSKTTSAKTTPRGSNQVQQTVAKPSSSVSKVATAAVVSGPISWRWPTDGKIVRSFSGDVHKGIDVAGKAGDRVSAVATGKVVYAGSGIVGYGNLLIVKHNDQYLSAYGHNRRLLVAEGNTVEQGQKIAEKGSSATNSVKLHFEIRREGKPVDPLKLLPGRK